MDTVHNGASKNGCETPSARRGETKQDIFIQLLDFFLPGKSLEAIFSQLQLYSSAIAQRGYLRFRRLFQRGWILQSIPSRKPLELACSPI
jgi:hypothetical protein